MTSRPAEPDPVTADASDEDDVPHRSASDASRSLWRASLYSLVTSGAIAASAACLGAPLLNVFLWTFVSAVALAALVVALVLVLARTWTMARVTRAALPIALVVTTQFLGILGSTLVLDRHVEDAKRWCGDVVTALEGHRVAHGTYPAALTEIRIAADPPRLCKSGLLYKPEGDDFILDFGTGVGVGGWAYRPSLGGWTRYD